MRRKISRSNYLQSVLTERIIFGKYPVGSRLPSTQELMKEFKISRSTLKRALDLLEETRLISRKNGCRPLVIQSTRTMLRHKGTQYKIALIRNVIRDGLHFPFHKGPWTWTLQELLQERLQEKHIPAIIIGSSDINRHAELLKSLSGCIYLCAHYQEETHHQLNLLGIRHVILTGQCAKPPEANMVCYDYSQANHKAAMYLLLHNLKSLDIISTPYEDKRLDRFFDLLKEWNFPGMAIFRMNLDAIDDNGKLDDRYGKSIPSEWKLPAGILCYTENHAARILSHLLRLGLRPKQDFRLIAMGKGFMLPDWTDHLNISGYTSDLPELADHTVSMLCNLLKSNIDQPNIHHTIDFQIYDT